MSTSRHPSLTLRLALLFALLAFITIVGLGVGLYRGLVNELVRRDEAALISRVEQLRTFLSDGNVLELIKTKPALFQNMMGNREAVLRISLKGGNTLLETNPGNLHIPPVTRVVDATSLSLDDVQHYPEVQDVPFAMVAVTMPSDIGELQVVAGRLMSERTALLAGYRLRIYLLATIAALLLAFGGCLLVHRGLMPLRRVARHTRRIGIENLSQRLDTRGVPRELLPVIDSFNTLLDRLSKGFTQLGEVSTDMAHELRTPINNMLGETQVALQQHRSVEGYQTLLASNVEELERLSRMLDNMLFLARTDPTSALGQRQLLNGKEELERIADYFEGPAADVGMDIRIASAGQVWAEPILLRRALANLCSNAIKYGAPNSKLSLAVNQADDGVTIAVSNHGATIAPEHLPRLFERFYRVDEAREQSSQSSGLGLAIVSTIMQLHNGRCSVTSQDGVTCFELFFPATGLAV
ncbi:heavy metal sensor histidine kinase [Pseudomonas sp. HR96]|uniref:heavy metal sensor histidine kinase n=1 Tax=Pseudomonas sp. HR96 TaxID=1027966 RepID=UPI002A762892|nr:heavy metal sensor histidine kinase [Pseudomonas sp. HR96]WPP00816.1 heavy metal sensor histidine kinase [Pseudomonas sp. HR96]